MTSSSSGLNDANIKPENFSISSNLSPADIQEGGQPKKAGISGDIGVLSYEAKDTISAGKSVFKTLDSSVVNGKVYGADLAFPQLFRPDQAKIDADPSTTVNDVSVVNDPTTISTQVLTNIDQVLADLQSAGASVQASLGSDNAGRILIQDFLKAVGEAIQGLKEQLRQLQVIDAQTSQKTENAKFDAIAGRQDQSAAMEKSNEEMRQKQEKMRQTNLAMKIVGPILAAISTIASTVLAVVTFGAAAPLIAASVLIGVAMVAYSIADSVANITSKAVDGFNKWIEGMVTVPPHTEAEQKAVKFAIIAAAAIVLAGVIALTVAAGGGGSAAATLVSETATLTTKEILLQSVKQVAIQMLIMIVMSSNAVPELITASLKQANISKDGQQAAQIASMVIMMLVMMLAMGKASGGSTGSVGDFFKGAGSTIKSSFETVSTGIKNAIDRGVKETASIVAQQIMDSIKETMQAIMDMLKNLKNLPQGIIDDVKDTFTLVTKEKGFIRLATSVAQASPSLANAIGGSIRASLLLQVSQILKQQGEIQASEELIKTMIDLLQKMINNLQGSIDSTGNDIQQLTQEFSRLYEEAGRSVGGLTQANLSQGV